MLLDRSKAPEFIIPADFELTPPQIKILSGGRTLFFIRTPNLEAVKLEVIGKSQRLSLPAEKSMVPSFTLQMLSEGTKTQTEAQLSDFFDFHASEVHPMVTYSHEGMSLVTTKKHLLNVIPTFISLFDQAIFPPDRLEKRKSQRKLGIKMDREKSATRASHLFRKALFGEGHPYGLEITEALVDGVEQLDLLNYYQKNLFFDIEFFLCGDLSEVELALIVSHLDKIPFAAVNKKITLPSAQSTPAIYEDRPLALQTSIRIGGRSVPKTHPDFMAFSTFNTILGGYFGSRLIKNIREDKGHTYGISSSLAEIGESCYWVIGADVQKTFRSEVISEIYNEISRLVNEPVSDEEIEVVRNYLIGQMLGQFSSAFDLIDRFRSVHDSGLDFDFYVQKMAFLRGFKADQILYIGKKYFSNPPFIEVVVG